MTVLSDRPFVRACIVAFLRQHGFWNVSEQPTWAALARSQEQDRGGLLIVDLGHGAEEPREIVRGVRACQPRTTIVAIGTTTELAAQAAEADGWLDISEPGDRLSEMAAAVAGPHEGSMQFRDLPLVARQQRTWSALTPRQRQVLGLLACGLDNKGVAAAIGVSERAVKAHVTSLLAAFKADNRTELALIACHGRLRASGSGEGSRSRLVATKRLPPSPSV